MDSLRYLLRDFVYVERLTLVLYILPPEKYVSSEHNCIYHYSVQNSTDVICKKGIAPLYPINKLRNLAIKIVQTQFYLPMDADIRPSGMTNLIVFTSR